MVLSESGERTVYTLCNAHCGGQCVLKAYVQDDIVTRLETDDSPEPQYRACMKGRAQRQTLYASDRLKWPMKRVGPRGEGRFERISWDEALETVAREIKRVRDSYGPEAIVLLDSGGDIGRLSIRTIRRLLAMAGGFTGGYCMLSYEAGVWAAVATFGCDAANHSRDDLLNSRLIIMWGWDPASSRTETRGDWCMAQAKEKGVRIIAVDPKFSDSAAAFAHQWIPIIPGTDTAMMIAMAYVMFLENLYDRKFLDTYTFGFDRFKDYVMGIEDGVPKTTAWAQDITGVPAATIAALAREYATTKPAALIAGIGPGRTSVGEQYHRAAITLSAMTGNIGKSGGSSGGRSYTGAPGAHAMKLGKAWEFPPNPVDQMLPPRTCALPNDWYPLSSACVYRGGIGRDLLKGKAGGFAADFKLLYVYQSNPVNASANTNRVIQALKNLVFIVVHEQFMSPTAKFADILLPHNHMLERNDIQNSHGEPLYYGFRNKVVDSQYESRSPFEICNALAERLGVKDFNTQSEEEKLREIVAGSDIPDYEAFRKAGSYKPRDLKPFVPFQKQIRDPANSPFPTPSGKIEIYSQVIADMNHPQLPPVPKYLEGWEGRYDPLAEKYPLQLLTSHPKGRAHGKFFNIPWARELCPQVVLMNSDDAVARGIKDGDLVSVFNDRGQVMIPAKLTQRIIPGVAEITEGGWYDPDENGVDRGGCANVLTKDEPSPGGAFPANSCLVQVQKA